MELLVNNKKINSISETSLNLAPNTTFEEWESIGQDLQRIGRCWQWWVGDWLNFGESQYGEKYTQAIETTGINPQSLMDCSYVSRNVEISLRNEIVSWSHHKAVAPLSKQEQTKWLKQSEKDALSVSELRAEIKDSKNPTDDIPNAVTVHHHDEPPMEQYEGFEPPESTEVNPQPTQINPEPDWKEHRKAAVNYANYLQRAIDDLNDVRGSGQKRRHADSIKKTQEVIVLLEGWT